jgi:hypothetical protein
MKKPDCFLDLDREKNLVTLKSGFIENSLEIDFPIFRFLILIEVFLLNLLLCCEETQ